MQPEGEAGTGAAAHFRALESLYRSVPINRTFVFDIEVGQGFAPIQLESDEAVFLPLGSLPSYRPG